jgi:hypothetical protein
MHTHIYIPIYLYIYTYTYTPIYTYHAHTHTHTGQPLHVYMYTHTSRLTCGMRNTDIPPKDATHAKVFVSHCARESLAERLAQGADKLLVRELAAGSLSFFFFPPFTAPLRCERARSRQTFCFIFYVILFFPFSFLARLRCARTRSRQPSLSSPAVSRMHVFDIHLRVYSTAYRAARPS